MTAAMTAAQLAAARILAAPRDEWFRDPASSLIDVIAGHVLAAADGEDLVRRRLADVAMAAAAAGVALAAHDRRTLVEQALAAMPVVHRHGALHVLDPLLARIDLAWAWSLVRDAVETDGTCVVTAMAAAALGIADAGVPEAFARPLEPVRALARALRGDPAAAAELERGLDGGAWRRFGAPEQVTWLGAGAVIDPGRVLGQLVAHPADHAARDLESVLGLLAAGLLAAGQGDRFVASLPLDRESRPDPHWLATAIRYRLMTGPPARAAVEAAIRRVEDFSDPGGHAEDGGVLLGALAALGDQVAAFELADRWTMPPPMLAGLVLDTGDRAFADHVLMAGRLDRLFARPRTDWQPEGDAWASDWWTVAEEHGDGRQACLDVIQLTGHAPWSAPPGGVADLVQLIRPGSAGQG